MENYFYKAHPVEERERIPYIPTVPQFVEWIGKTWSDRPAVNNLEESYTYSELCERIARRRGFMITAGLKKGDKVAIMDVNSIDAVELFLAATSAGFVAIMLPTQLPAPAVVGSCLRFDVKALFIGEAFKDRSVEVKCNVYSTKDTYGDAVPVAEVDKEDPAAIFFTGGTTGAPKGAVLPHRALMRGAFNGTFCNRAVLNGERFMGLLPLSHVFGLIKGTLSALYIGAEWYASNDIKESIGKMPVIKPTMLVLVPGLCDVLVGVAKMYGTQFFGGALKTIITGAANVPPRLSREFEKLGIDMFPGYGMTEGANLSTGNLDVKRKPTSVGKLFPEQEIKIVNGEVWMKGDHLFLGYYNDPKATAEVLTEDGWLKTGDLGYIDDEGFIYITGRIKNLIILPNAENVSPEELEEPFYLNDAVRDCLVKEDKVNDTPCLAIEILPNMEMFPNKSQEEINAFFHKLVDEINAKQPSTHRIAKVTVRTEDFKRTGALKVARNQ